VPEYNSTGEGQSQHFWQTNLIYPVVARLFSFYLDYSCQMLIFNLWKKERNGSLRGAFVGGRFGRVRTIGASDPAYGAYTDNI
jgi:hypothetical protein